MSQHQSNDIFFYHEKANYNILQYLFEYNII